MKYPWFVVPTSFLSCCNVGMVFQCDFIVLNDTFLSPPSIWQRFAVFVIVIPTVQNVPVTIFVLVAFLQLFMCIVKHAPPHRWSMSGSMGRILLNNAAGDWQDVVSSLVQLSILSDGCMHLPQVQYTMPTSQNSSKYSVLPILVINSFDFSLNGSNSSVLFKSFINESRFGWFSNCWISLFTFSLRLESSFWTVEWGKRWTPSSTLPRQVSFVSDEFPRTSRFVRFDGRRMFSLRD